MIAGLIRNTSVFQILRRFKRSLITLTSDHPLTDRPCHVEFKPDQWRYEVEEKGSFNCPLQITNHNEYPLSSHGAHPVRLAVRWWTQFKDRAHVFESEMSLPESMPARSVLHFEAKIPTPAILGTFNVEFALKQSQRILPLVQHSQPIAVHTNAKAQNDIDYHQLYSSANLKNDYWLIVGPSTHEEFMRLAKVKREQLIDLGLTPDSRVLDVGCGTGQLAMALEPYLSDQGVFVGTDIGAEAIPFCRERYKRPNFRFLVNEMTRIPIQNEVFDFITFISVFTHTYPDETALILAEAKRVLAKTGTIIADIFTSPYTDRCEGNRGAMELNRDHFLRLVELAGLQAKRLKNWKWKDYTEREIFLLTHRE